MAYLVSDPRKVTTLRFGEMKQRGEKISMLTAYDLSLIHISEPTTSPRHPSSTTQASMAYWLATPPPTSWQAMLLRCPLHWNK